MISDSKIIEIFCSLDDFMKEFNLILNKNSISDGSTTKKRNRKFKMSDSEVMTILVIFHLKSYRNLKHFYLNHICKYRQDLFPDCVSYNRFVELQKKVTQPLAVFMKMYCLGDCTGISFIDSTPLKVCHYKREKQHQVFKDIAKKSYGTMGWYFGFKLHIVCNDKGEIIDFMFTPANVDDRFPLKQKSFTTNYLEKFLETKDILGKIYLKDFL